MGAASAAAQSLSNETVHRMSRNTAILSALGALALFLFIGLVTDLFGPGEPEVMINRYTGEPLTLEAVQKELEWRRETAGKLRQGRN